ncbi:MAG: TIGR03013 family PEP-CTERM/XrtA system glycosyltransferase [Alphaproteobacteria bacterium]|nr:TIGR03013 family PEP-CTERM/XrtA system glycosyltransferase [Alphaproteobacteria bacterium]
MAWQPTAKRRRVFLLGTELAVMATTSFSLVSYADSLSAGSVIVDLIGSIVSAAGFVAIMLAMGLYGRDTMYSSMASIQRFAMAYFIFFFAAYVALVVAGPLVMFGFWSADLSFVGVTGGSAAVVLLFRIFFVHILSLDWFKRRLVIVGCGNKAAKLCRVIVGKLQHEAVVVATVRFTEDEFAPDLIVPVSVNGDLLGLCERVSADEIIVARDDQRGMPIDELLHCRTVGIRIRDYITFLEEEIGYIDVNELRPSALIFSWGFDRSPAFLASKRLFDVVVSVLILFFALPLALFAAVAIVIDSRGPIFFRQDRVGLNGHRFQILKFRSMRVDAERHGPQWAAAQDNRVTTIGRILRKTRIDEIPQLINVLKGDMSFVGPRPERPFFVDSLRVEIPYYDERHKMKPGLTGWAQINYPYGASVEDAKEKLAYDLYYAKYASLMLDLMIALQTLKVVMFPSGAR